MGGDVAFIFRDPEGVVHSGVSWTNPFSYFINDMKIVNKNVAYVHEYLDGHCRRYEKQFKVKPGVYPVEYGMIVLDMVSNKILHSQGYTDDIGKVSNFDVFGRPRYDENADRPMRKKVAEFSKRKRLRYATGNKRGVERKFKVATMADMDAIVDKYDPYAPGNRGKEGKNVYHCLRLVLDMKPFTVTRFAEGAVGLRELRDELERLGFKLTRHDKVAWDRFMKGFSDDA